MESLRHFLHDISEAFSTLRCETEDKSKLSRCNEEISHTFDLICNISTVKPDFQLYQTFTCVSDNV